MLLDNFQKLDHNIILVLTTAVVNKKIDFRHLVFFTIWLRIIPLVIDPKKEARVSVLYTLISFKSSPSINWTNFIRSIMNIQAVNIGRLQVIGRYCMFNFEAWQKDILAHVHGHCNILFLSAWMLCLFINYFIFVSFLQIICLGYLWMWWKGLPLWFCVLCIFTSNLISLMISGSFPYP